MNQEHTARWRTLDDLGTQTYTWSKSTLDEGPWSYSGSLPDISIYLLLYYYLQSYATDISKSLVLKQGIHHPKLSISYP